MPRYSQICFSLLIILASTACRNNSNLYRPGVPSIYSIIIGIEPKGQVLEEDKLADAFRLLKMQLENYGIIYQSVEEAPEQRQITFNIIGRMTAAGEEDPGLDYYLNVLAGGSQLELWETYQNIDQPVREMFGALVTQYNIGDKLVFTHSELYPESSYPSAVIAEVAPEHIALLDSIFRHPEAANLMPDDMVLVWSFNAVQSPDGGSFFELYALKKSIASGPFLTGSDLISVEASPGDEPDKAVIDLEFTPEAARIFAEKTRQLSQGTPKREIAFLLDGFVITAPKVMNEISGGRCPINGNFEVAEALRIRDKLKFGALPFEFKVLEIKQ